MPQARRALVALVSVIAIVLGFAPSAFAQTSTAVATTTAAPKAGVTTKAVRAATITPGYWLADDTGGVFSGGSAQAHGSIGSALNRPIVGIASTATRAGYWLVASDGGVFSFGDAKFHGSTGNITLNKPIVGMAATPSGNGYWFVASDGGIFSFGDAKFHGSTGNITLNKPIVGMAATPSGNGYWMVASDGGIFSFGDAKFHGSTGNIHLNMPISGMASTITGQGYWLVASDGGVFSFGDAAFHGSTGNITLNKPIVGMATTPSGNGYWFVASDGGVFSFGDAPFLGSGTVGNHGPVVGIAPSAIFPATKLAFTTQPGGAGAGAPFSTQPVVSVQNAGGGPAITDTSSVNLELTTPGGATFGCDLNPLPAVAGVAKFTGCSIDTAGTYTLTATDGTLAAATSTTITVGLGATQLAFTTQPSPTATGGTPFAVQPVVEVRDALGLRVATDTTAVTLALTTPGGATLACTSNPKVAVAGIATFSGCKIDLANLAAYTLTATDAALTPAVSAGTTVSVGAAAKLAFTQQPGGVAVNSAFAPQPQVTIQDAGGNPVTDNTSSVTLALNGPGIFSCTSANPLDATAGVATFVGCQTDTSGVGDTLTATATGLTLATSDPFTITP